MAIRLFISSLLLLLFSCADDNSQITQVKANETPEVLVEEIKDVQGKLIKRITYKPDEFGDTGKIEANFLNGKLHGEYLRWYPSGNKEMQINYSNGKLNGIALVWFENTLKEFEMNFVQDTLNGLSQSWWNDYKHSKHYELNYKMGNIEGDFFMTDIYGYECKGKFEDEKFISNTSPTFYIDIDIDILESFYDRLYGTDLLGNRKERIEF